MWSTCWFFHMQVLLKASETLHFSVPTSRYEKSGFIFYIQPIRNCIAPNWNIFSWDQPSCWWLGKITRVQPLYSWCSRTLESHITLCVRWCGYRAILPSLLSLPIFSSSLFPWLSSQMSLLKRLPTGKWVAYTVVTSTGALPLVLDSG